jgi:hypothetical protein
MLALAQAAKVSGRENRYNAELPQPMNTPITFETLALVRSAPNNA